METLKLGRYRHYKGNEYRALFVARHTETEEDLVIYHDIRTPEKIWARPLSMFLESVEVNGAVMPRFTYLGA